MTAHSKDDGMKEALERCPFCGDALVLITEPVGDDMHKTETFWAHTGHRQSDCWLSDATIPHDPDEIAAWNRRSSSAAASGVVDSLEEILDYRGGAESALHDEYVIDRARLALSSSRSAGGSEVATRADDGPTAPISTDTKGTTK